MAPVQAPLLAAELWIPSFGSGCTLHVFPCLPCLLAWLFVVLALIVGMCRLFQKGSLAVLLPDIPIWQYGSHARQCSV